jgi:hypothetical protein
MKNNNSSLLASLNGSGVRSSGYVLRQSLQNVYVAAFTSSDWSWIPTEDIHSAQLFSSMTQALAVGFCLGFGAAMEAIPHDSKQVCFSFHR